MDSLEIYIESIKGFGRITKEVERELSRIIRRSQNTNNVEKAQEKLIHGNLFLVVDRAIRLQKKYNFLGANLMDLIAEGNIALMIAAKNYRSDHKSNASFGSFAVTVIDNKIIRSIRNNRLIHLPEHYLKCRYDLKKLNEKYKGKITDDIIKKELGISEDMLCVLKDDVNKKAIFLEDLFLCEDGDNRDWNDFLEDSKNISPFEKASVESLRDCINGYLEKLSVIERKVIREKHFVDSPKSFCEIAMSLNISKERVRQVYMVALRKLKRYMAEDWEAKNGKLEAENKSNYSNCIMPQVFNENKKQDRCDKVFEQLLWGG